VRFAPDLEEKRIIEDLVSARTALGSLKMSVDSIVLRNERLKVRESLEKRDLRVSWGILI
jgi:hypothetical protein